MAKIWSVDEVKQKLEANEHYKDFYNEYNGRFSCIYDIDGVAVAIFNEVGGIHSSVYFLGLLRMDADIQSAQSFAAVCYLYLNKELNKRNKK